MTEAPKRIWAWPDKGNPESVTGRWSCNTYSSDLTQSYILATEHERLMAERDAEIARLRMIALRAFTVVEWVVGEGFVLEAPHEDADDLLLVMVDGLGVEDSFAARAALGDDNEK